MKRLFRKHRLGVRVSTLLLVVILAFPFGGPTAAFAQNPHRNLNAAPIAPDWTLSILKNSPVSQQGMVSVIVKLKGDALASYQGNLLGLAATSPSKMGEKRLDLNSNASRAYMSYLDKTHQSFKTAVSSEIQQAKITYDYQVVLNSVAVVLPADQLGDLSSLPGVEAVYPDELLKLDTDSSDQFIGAPTLWKQLGGQESSGEDVIVGLLDTGIWPEHPSFSDPDPSGKEYASAAEPLSGTRACDFDGGSNPGDLFTCNNKLIGAQVFLNTYSAQIGPMAGEFTSARDGNGHGTHTSSTAAGNAGVKASINGVSLGTISGIAPRAHVMMYKVCGESGCFTSDSAAAIQEAILDGVNVINFSISGGSSPYFDPVELAFLDAYDAGVFVAASAGNSGPGENTTDHRGPWVTTVGASTQSRAFQNTAAVSADGGARLTLTGASLTGGVGPAPVHVPTKDLYCNGPFAPGSFTGAVVVCQRGGGPGRAQKGFNVLQGGAVGMILYNQSPIITDLETDNHFLPTIHIQYKDGVNLLSFIASHTNVKAKLTAGEPVTAQGDVMASFSSRGGTSQRLGVSKPDIAAPGVQILAGNSPKPVDATAGPQGELFQAIAGTSMASPHIAGAGALLKALHPDWTPGQIKSALMTTAETKMVKEDGITPATPFDDGSGRVDLSKAGNPGLTFDVIAAEYKAHEADLWNVNYPSVFIPSLPGRMTVKRTAHSVLAGSSQWALWVEGAEDFNVSVPPVLAVPKNGDVSFNIKI